VWALGGCPETVAAIIRHNMGCKNGVSRAARAVPFMDIFPVLDDMARRHPFPSVRGDFFLPGHGWRRNKSLSACGISPLARWNGADRFTVTVNRFPFRFNFEDIPNFFVGEWEDLRPFLEALV